MIWEVLSNNVSILLLTVAVSVIFITSESTLRNKKMETKYITFIVKADKNIKAKHINANRCVI